MSRVVVVTGGTRGIGAAISKALKAAGYQVAATYHGNDEAAAKFKAETGVQTYKWDVSSFEACSTGLAQVAKDLGPVDVLVNNAGITKDGMFHKMTPEQWYAVINTNLNSLFNMTRPVIDGMRERGFGRIINISSVNGQKGQMGQVNYSASKAGDLGFTKALAQENANKGITVNAICPGYIATEMVMAVPKDVLEKSILPQIAVRRLGQPGARYEKVREGGVVTSQAVLIAIGIDWDGRRQILAVEPRKPFILEGLPHRLAQTRPQRRRVGRRRRSCRPALGHPRGPVRRRLPALLRPLPAQRPRSPAAQGRRRLPAGAALALRPPLGRRGPPRPRRLDRQMGRALSEARRMGRGNDRGDAHLLPAAAPAS